MKIVHLALLVLLITCAASWEFDSVPCNDTECIKCDQNNTICTLCNDTYYLNDKKGVC